MSLTLRKLIEQSQRIAFDNPELLDAPVQAYNGLEDVLDETEYAPVSSVVFEDDSDDDSMEGKTVVINLRG